MTSGIWDLFGREWLERLWIQQEIRLATAEAVIICGHSSILCKDLRKAALRLFNKLSLNPTLNKERLRQV